MCALEKANVASDLVLCVVVSKRVMGVALQSSQSILKCNCEFSVHVQVILDRNRHPHCLVLISLFRIADDFFGAGCVLPPDDGARKWASVDLAKARGSMRINGTLVGEGVGADIVSGHPLEALAWLANKRAETGESLAEGEIVMLGSVVKTHWLAPGDTVECEVEGLGAVKVTFV